MHDSLEIHDCRCNNIVRGGLQRGKEQLKILGLLHDLLCGVHQLNARRDELTLLESGGGLFGAERACSSADEYQKDHTLKIRILPCEEWEAMFRVAGDVNRGTGLANFDLVSQDQEDQQLAGHTAAARCGVLLRKDVHPGQVQWPPLVL